MDRKKELKEEYKLMKPEMGVFIIRSKTNNKYFLEGTQNLKGYINGTVFKLDSGSHPNKELQKEWTELGRDKFTVDILERLEYDEDESRTDYKDDLDLLCMEWEEKLTQENMVLFKKRL